MKIKIICSLLIISTFILSSCDKNFEEINTDPTKLTSRNTNYNYLFTSAQLVTAGNEDGYSRPMWQASLSYASTMMQHLSSTSSFWYGDKYMYNQAYNAAYWEAQYSNGIKTIVDIIENVKTDTAKSNLYNMARIFKAFMFHRITDIYGDVPYFEAGKGYLSGNTAPVYDKQQAIYADLLKELEDAAQKLNAAKANTVKAADLLYGGDVVKWKRFAYSLMTRLAMRLSKVDAETAKTWVQKAVAGGVIASNDDNAIVHHEAKGTQPPTNPVGLQFALREPASYRLSQTFVDYLKNTSDPRLTYFATVAHDPEDLEDMGDTDPAIQVGQPNGYDRLGGTTDITHAPNWPDDQNHYSIVNRHTFGRQDAPTFLLTHAETQLLLAEAAQRGWISGSAASFYNAGVTAAMQQLEQAGADPGVSEDEIDDYLAAHPYNSANGLQMINTQYWIATFSDWLETWANWRRSGFPVLQPVNYFGNPTNGTIPRRFTYPMNEVTYNLKNYNAATASINGGDKMTSRVWWDKQ